MNRISRLKKHLFTTMKAARSAFPRATLKAIETAIADGERLHRAEVRLIVEHALSINEVLRHTTSRQRAIELFAQFRIWDTEENCGVLVYINLADRKVEIVADRMIAQQVSQEEWNAVCKTMTDGFAKQEFRESTATAMTQLNELLQSRLPAQGTHSNQLPNAPIVL